MRMVRCPGDCNILNSTETPAMHESEHLVFCPICNCLYLVVEGQEPQLVILELNFENTVSRLERDIESATAAADDAQHAADIASESVSDALRQIEDVKDTV